MGNCHICKTYLAPPFDGYCPKCEKYTIEPNRKDGDYRWFTKRQETEMRKIKEVNYG